MMRMVNMHDALFHIHPPNSATPSAYRHFGSVVWLPGLRPKTVGKA
jgi:hypothetical protein